MTQRHYGFKWPGDSTEIMQAKNIIINNQVSINQFLFFIKFLIIMVSDRDNIVSETIYE